MSQSASEDETASEPEHRLFRERVVKSWGWRPGTPIKLTTTEYAQTYLSRYSNRRQLLAQIERGVVLFQTRALDIVVAGISSTSVWIIDRRSDETLWSGLVERPETGEFVQLIDDVPPELALNFRLRPAPGVSDSYYVLFSLKDSGRILLSLTQSFDFGQCPSVHENPGQSIGSRSHAAGPLVDSGKGAKTLTFPQESILIPYERKHCAIDKLRAATSYVCKYAKSQTIYKCNIHVDIPVEIDHLSDIQLDGEGLSDREATWLIANRDKLRRHGFLLSDNVITQLRNIMEADNKNETN